MPGPEWPDVYRELDVKPLINAQSWVTSLGGSLMRPEVVRAMEDASRAFVDMVELNRAAGKVVAEACGAEAGLVTSGCAAAQVMMAAACMTGRDEKKVEQLPDTTGMKDRVVIFKGQHNRYEGAFEVPGSRLVEFGTADGATAEDLDNAITDRTCAVAFVIGPFLNPGIGLEETVRVAHARGVPVILDAAAEVPPRRNLSRFIEMGVDLVAFSGGKGIGGPQSTGLLAGKADLVEAAFMNALNLHSPKAGIGRPMKVSKENLIGIVTAIKLTLEIDEAAELAGWRNKAEHVTKQLKGINGLHIAIEDTPVDRQGPQPIIYFEEGWTGPSADEVRQKLREGNPPIFVGGRADQIAVVMVNVQDGEEVIIADRLEEILRS